MPAGPMGPLRSEMGADELGLRSRAGRSVSAVVEAMLGRQDTTRCLNEVVVVGCAERKALWNGEGSRTCLLRAPLSGVKVI